MLARGVAACPRCPPPSCAWGQEGGWRRLLLVLAGLPVPGVTGLHLPPGLFPSSNLLGVLEALAMPLVGHGVVACPRCPAPSCAWG